MPSRSAGGIGAAGGRICASIGRSSRGLRRARAAAAPGVRHSVLRSGTRRCGLAMPGGRPRGLPECPFANRPRASRARVRTHTRAATEKRSDQAIDSPRFRFRNAANCRRKQAEGQEFRAQAALRGRGCTAYKFMICSRQGPACRRGASVFEIPLLHPSVASAPGRQSKIPTRRRRYGGPAPRADTDHLRMPVLVRIGRLGRALFGAYQPVQLADRRGHLALQRSDDVRSG